MRRACEKFDEKKPPHVLMGRFCSVTNYICFLIAGNHPYKNVSTFPFDVRRITEKIFGSTEKIPFKCPNHNQVVVGHDVWIGRGVTILGGVKIGNGAVIGAGAVVAKDIPPYAIVVGNPARVVKYRFDEATIKKFLAVKWWNWSLEKIAENFPLMADVEKFLATHYSPALENFPEDDLSRYLVGFDGRVYQFIADFRAVKPLWKKIVRDFCQSDFKDKLLVVYLDKDATEEDFYMLEEAINLFDSEAKEKILVSVFDEKVSPRALRMATYFITTREMTTLEALDYLWGTDVKIVSALDEDIF